MGAFAGNSALARNTASLAGSSASSAGSWASSAETSSKSSDPSPFIPLHPQLPASDSRRQQAAAAAASTGQFSLPEQHLIHPVQAGLVSEPVASRSPQPAAPPVGISSAGLLSVAAEHDAAQLAPKDLGLLSSDVLPTWPAWFRSLRRVFARPQGKDAIDPLVSGSSTAFSGPRVHSLMPFLRTPSQPARVMQANPDEPALEDASESFLSDGPNPTDVDGVPVEHQQRLKSFPRVHGHEPDARMELRDADERARSVICKRSTLRHQACQGTSTSSWSGVG